MTICKKIRRVLAEGPSTHAEVASELGIPKRIAIVLLDDMSRRGFVKKTGDFVPSEYKRRALNLFTLTRRGLSTIAILLFAVSIARGQAVAPFVQVGAFLAPTEGYSKPVPFIEPGLEVDGRRLTSVSYFDYSPFLSKSTVKGLGSSIGGESLDYWRLTRSLSLGGGASIKRISVPIWIKYSSVFYVGTLFEGRSNRLFLNYYRAFALDQNHLEGAQAIWEAGSGRFRPIFRGGPEHFTEPSYCVSACVNHLGWEFEAGLKIVLEKRASSGGNY